MCPIRSCTYNELPSGAIIQILVLDQAVSSDVAKGMGRGGGFNLSGVIVACLQEQVEPGAVFPLQAMNAALVRRHPGFLDSLMCGLHQSDGDPTLDVSARPGVGVTSLCCEADGYPSQGSQHLHTQYPINGGCEGRKVLMLLEECFQ